MKSFSVRVFKNRLLIYGLQALLLAALAWVGLYFRRPWLAELRSWLFAPVLLLTPLLVGKNFFDGKARHGLAKTASYALALGMLAAACLLASEQVAFLLRKYSVLQTEPARLQKLGRHFIVGYDRFEEVAELVRRGAVGGVFMTQKNVRGKSKEEISGEIAFLQGLQARQGLPPLWIATDQEGGRVSRLSPPLTQLPALSSLLEAAETASKLEAKVTDYGLLQAGELAELGFNLNFSPVVDLKIRPARRFYDAHSAIESRAISADPLRVYEVATWYCRAFEKRGVTPTLKHFPGLARVHADTHLRDGQVEADLSTLEAGDWIPFRHTLGHSGAMMMLGHARLPQIDEEFPVSLSKKVVQGVLRQNWNHQGLLITDDLAMGAVASREGGAAEASLVALNAGVDLLLLSYEGELYYEALERLLQAETKGELDTALLAQSEARLARALAQKQAGDKNFVLQSYR